jgi:hypothetical protein
MKAVLLVLALLMLLMQALPSGQAAAVESEERQGRPSTLNEIEHDILRAEFGDPRVHFAIVCAPKVCPLLAGRAYYGDTLNERLDGDESRDYIESEQPRIEYLDYDWSLNELVR